MTAEGSIDYIDKLLNNFSPEGSVDRTGKQEAFRGGFRPRFFLSLSWMIGSLRPRPPRIAC